MKGGLRTDPVTSRVVRADTPIKGGHLGRPNSRRAQKPLRRGYWDKGRSASAEGGVVGRPRTVTESSRGTELRHYPTCQPKDPFRMSRSESEDSR